MVLAVDGSRLEGRRLGVGRYVETLLLAWAQQDLPFEEVRVFTRAPLPDLLPAGRLHGIALPCRGPGSWWQLRRLRPQARKADALFSTYTLPPGYRGPSVIAIQGILAGRYAASGAVAHLRDRHTAASARRAEVVIVHSPTTRDDVVEHYRVAPEKVRIVKPGLDPRFRPARREEEEAVATEVERWLGARRPFVIFVGKLSHRRNVPALIDAFRALATDHPELGLLLVGPNTGRVDLSRLPAHARHVEFLELDELARLYRAARALVLPTEREGFGHPIVEAMASGSPAVLLAGSAVGALDWAEAGRRPALVLEAEAVTADSLEQALRRMVEDDGLHLALSEQGLAFARTFPPWGEHAGAVMQVLAEVAQGRS